MPRSKKGKEHIRKLLQFGSKGSYAVTLPINAIRDLRWREGQRLDVQYDESRKRIVIMNAS